MTFEPEPGSQVYRHSRPCGYRLQALSDGAEFPFTAHPRQTGRRSDRGWEIRRRRLAGPAPGCTRSRRSPSSRSASTSLITQHGCAKCSPSSTPRPAQAGLSLSFNMQWGRRHVLRSQARNGLRHPDRTRAAPWPSSVSAYTFRHPGNARPSAETDHGQRLDVQVRAPADQVADRVTSQTRTSSASPHSEPQPHHPMAQSPRP